MAWEREWRGNVQLLRESDREIHTKNMNMKMVGYICKQADRKNMWDGEIKSQPLVLAVCTLLMVCAHQPIKQAGDIVYCDSTSSLDRYNYPTFIMSTCLSAGGIPF